MDDVVGHTEVTPGETGSGTNAGDGVLRRHRLVKKYAAQAGKVEIHGRLLAFQVSEDEIIELCGGLYRQHHLPLKIITAFDERHESGFFRIMYIFSLPDDEAFLAPYILVEATFPSLTPRLHEASIYERKIKSFFGLQPRGHPNPRPLILHENWPENTFPLRKDFDWNARPAETRGVFQFRKLGGEGIYEIPVGPVHAGIIEPGHFRFSVAGEEILLLEPRLGYSHKGSEKLFETLALPDKLKLAERISGDSSFSHALTFCLALEDLSGATVPERVDYLRVVFCELERLANHLGDIGAIMTDAGYNFGGAACGRLRETVMQMSEALTGSRFLRGVALPGGSGINPTAESIQAARAAIAPLEKDFSEVMSVAEKSGTLMSRLINAGILSPAIARDHGVRGVAAKAVGLAADTRADHPYAAYRKLRVSAVTEEQGDVFARFRVRVREVHQSAGLLRKAFDFLILDEKAQDKPCADAAPLAAPAFRKSSFAAGVVEGWRGAIVYLVATDSHGAISRVDVRDPSFLNWTALGYAGQENMVPDFPLINKSFNLSYSGNDL